MSKQQVAILVDAGYFYKQGMEVLFGHGKTREESALNEALAVEMLFAKAEHVFRKPALRIYWYDAPPERDKLSQSQRDLGLCSGVKLRMGELNGSGQQKCVDGFIIKDMGELSRNGAVDSILLVSGDADLRLAVEEAQGHGVKVVLLGIGEDGNASVSGSMAMEADGVERLLKSELKKVLSLKSRQGAAAPQRPAQDNGHGKNASRKRSDKKGAFAAQQERSQAPQPQRHHEIQARPAQSSEQNRPANPANPARQSQPQHQNKNAPGAQIAASLDLASSLDSSASSSVSVNPLPAQQTASGGQESQSKRRGHRGGARHKKALMQQQEAQRRLEQDAAPEAQSQAPALAAPSISPLASEPIRVEPIAPVAPLERAHRQNARADVDGASALGDSAPKGRKTRSSYRSAPGAAPADQIATRADPAPSVGAPSAVSDQAALEPAKAPKERRGAARAKAVDHSSEGGALPAKGSIGSEPVIASPLADRVVAKTVKSRPAPTSVPMPSAEKRAPARKPSSKRAPMSLDAILAKGANPNAAKEG